MSIKTREKDAANKRVQVNIWNYDPAWKVECLVDGAAQPIEQNLTGFDWEAITLYKGEQLPKSRPFVEPKRTDHVFEAVIPITAKLVKVMATDRFGKQYSTEYSV